MRRFKTATFINDGVEYNTTTNAVKKTIISRLIVYRYTNYTTGISKIHISMRYY